MPKKEIALSNAEVTTLGFDRAGWTEASTEHIRLGRTVFGVGGNLTFYISPIKPKVKFTFGLEDKSSYTKQNIGSIYGFNCLDKIQRHIKKGKVKDEDVVRKIVFSYIGKQVIADTLQENIRRYYLGQPLIPIELIAVSLKHEFFSNFSSVVSKSGEYAFSHTNKEIRLIYKLMYESTDPVIKEIMQKTVFFKEQQEDLKLLSIENPWDAHMVIAGGSQAWENRVRGSTDNPRKSYADRAEMPAWVQEMIKYRKIESIKQELFSYIQDSNVDAVKRLLQKESLTGEDIIHCKNLDDNTSWSIAVNTGSVEMVRLLTEKADFSIKTPHILDMVVLACQTNNLDIVYFLAQQITKVDAKPDCYAELLADALGLLYELNCMNSPSFAKDPCIKLINTLSDKGIANFNDVFRDAPLFFLAADFELWDIVARSLRDVSPETVNFKNIDNHNVLSLAEEAGRYEIVKMLRDKGVGASLSVKGDPASPRPKF